MTFDLDLWPIDLTINRDHLLIKDYLPTKFEACGAKRCWVIWCTRFGSLTWPLTLTFDLLSWLSIGIIYSSRTIYLPSLKLLGHSVVELSVAQSLRGLTWPLTFDLLTWLSIVVFQLGQNRRVLRPSCPPLCPSCPPLPPSALPCALLAPLDAPNWCL